MDTRMIGYGAPLDDWEPHRRDESYTTLEQLIKDATGWHAVWEYNTSRGAGRRIVHITNAEYLIFSKWAGVEIIQLVEGAQDGNTQGA